MAILRFVWKSSPNSIRPSCSAIMAASFGRRASNNSLTRGKPPVISFVLDSRGIKANTSPSCNSWPSLTVTMAPFGKYTRTSAFLAFFTTSPFALTNVMCGRNGLPEPAFSDSIMTFSVNPVPKSVRSSNVLPVIMSWYLTLPEASAMIGLEYGSHSTKRVPFFTSSPSFTMILEP